MEEKAPLSELIREFIKGNILIVGLISLGVVLASIGIIQYISSNNKNSEVEFVKGAESQAFEAKSTTDSLKKITVDVEGAVQSPGVYDLVDGARIQDALKSAGGLANNADSDFVSKKLNLAQKVIDGGKIYIPAIGENVPATAVSTSNSTTNILSTTDTTSNLIDINSADESSLDTLPKIGPVTAKKIIAGRPYGSIEELVSKKVVTQKAFDGFKDRIVAQ